MANRLQNKSAIVTGAASGIGRATAELFAREGARLVINDVNETRLNEIAAGIAAAGDVKAVRCDNVRLAILDAGTRINPKDVGLGSCARRARDEQHRDAHPESSSELGKGDDDSLVHARKPTTGRPAVLTEEPPPMATAGDRS